MFSFLLLCLPFIGWIIVAALFVIPLLWGPILAITVLAHITQFFSPTKNKKDSKEI